MFGFRESFDYFQCGKCKCLQINNVPINIEKYYPKNYYSFSVKENLKDRLVSPLEKQRTRYILFNHGIFGRCLYRLLPNFPNFPEFSKLEITKDTKILDVGCGSGLFLHKLKTAGIKNVLGVDKFINSTITYENGLKIIKGTLEDVSGQWDIVLFRHSFEHLYEQTETLEKVRLLLSEDGFCIIVVPTVSSYAWTKYGVDWVQIDAPRHFFLHSIQSMQILADNSGFEVKDILYSSNDFQFVGSELYKRNIPLIGEETIYSYFSREELSKFSIMAKALDSKNQGDTVTFYLKKKL
ncbi:MAG: class I SAM-dependent methyltransferase [Candidatus Bathyarchaeia archaeon]